MKILLKSNSSGFTLIELLIVMVIIGILAGFGLGSFNSSQIKARDAQRKSDLKSITSALEIFYNDKGYYPSGSGTILGCGSSETSCVWGSSFSGTGGTLYMAELPRDPSGGQTYYYLSNGDEYRVFARLENLKDESIPYAGDAPQSYTGTVCSSSGSRCNYGVASSNVVLEDIGVVND